MSLSMFDPFNGFYMRRPRICFPQSTSQAPVSKFVQTSTPMAKKQRTDAHCPASSRRRKPTPASTLSSLPHSPSTLSSLPFSLPSISKSIVPSYSCVSGVLNHRRLSTPKEKEASRKSFDLFALLPESLQAEIFNFLPSWDVSYAGEIDRATMPSDESSKPEAYIQNIYWYRCNCALVCKAWHHLIVSVLLFDWKELGLRLLIDRSMIGFNFGIAQLRRLLPRLELQLQRWQHIPRNHGHYFLQHPDVVSRLMYHHKVSPTPFSPPESHHGQGITIFSRLGRTQLTALQATWIRQFLFVYRQRLPFPERVSRRELDNFARALHMDDEATASSLLAFMELIWPPWSICQTLDGALSHTTHSEDMDHYASETLDHVPLWGNSDENVNTFNFGDYHDDDENEMFPPLDWTSRLSFPQILSMHELAQKDQKTVDPIGTSSGGFLVNLWAETICPLHGVAPLQSKEVLTGDFRTIDSSQIVWSDEEYISKALSTKKVDLILSSLLCGATWCWFLMLLTLCSFENQFGAGNETLPPPHNLFESIEVAFGLETAQQYAGFLTVCQGLFGWLRPCDESGNAIKYWYALLHDVLDKTLVD